MIYSERKKSLKLSFFVGAAFVNIITKWVWVKTSCSCFCCFLSFIELLQPWQLCFSLFWHSSSETHLLKKEKKGKKNELLIQQQGSHESDLRRVMIRSVWSRSLGTLLLQGKNNATPYSLIRSLRPLNGEAGVGLMSPHSCTHFSIPRTCVFTCQEVFRSTTGE